MFERFTDRARNVVQLSNEEARRIHHNYIGTEHLLLGLLSEGEGVAAQVLKSFDIKLDAVRAAVEEVIGQGQQLLTDRPVPFTPRAKKVLELALREALKLQHNYIGTEHILLALIHEGEGVAARVLIQEFRLNLAEVRARVISILFPTASPEDPRVVASSQGDNETSQRTLVYRDEPTPCVVTITGLVVEPGSDAAAALLALLDRIKERVERGRG